LRAPYPPIAAELTVSRRLARLSLLLLAALAAALAVAGQLSLPERSCAVLLTAVLAVPGVRRVVWLRGPNAVRAFEWSAAGHWRVLDGAGSWRDAHLLPRSAAIGPFLLLVWTCGGWRRYAALIDGSAVPVAVHRQLVGRLRIGVRGAPHRTVDNS
jgi:hypothetical protein